MRTSSKYPRARVLAIRELESLKEAAVNPKTNAKTRLIPDILKVISNPQKKTNPRISIIRGLILSAGSLFRP